MKTKTLSTWFAVFAAVLFSITLVSAIPVVEIDDSSLPTSVTHDGQSFTFDFTITNNGIDAETFTVDADNLLPSGTTVSFSANSVTLDAAETSGPITATVIYLAHKTGAISGAIEATGDVTNTSTDDAFSVSIDDSTDLQIIVEQALSSSQNGIYKIENTGNKPLGTITLTAAGSLNVTITPATISGPAAGTMSTQMFTVAPLDLDDLEFGSQSVVLTATGANGGSDSLTAAVSNNFCIAGEQGGKLEIKDADINNRGDGEDDEWFFLDTIEVDVEVENTDNDDDVDEVFVEIGIFDSNGDDVTNDFDFENDDEEEFELGRLRDGDDDTVTFIFRVPADADEDDYSIVVKAYDDDSDFGEDMECTEELIDTVSIEPVEDEDRFVVVDDIIVDQQTSCGEVVSGSFIVYNIGEDDQSRVQVQMFSNDLGVDQEFELIDFDEGEDEQFSFSFAIPNSAEDGRYNLEFRTLYDYRRGRYDANSDRTFFTQIEVLGCEGSFDPISNVPNLVITASLESDVVAGEELVIEAQITNTGDEFISAAVDAQGFEGWAELDSLSPSIVSLNPGQSNTVEMTFIVDEDASGSETFVIQTRNVASNQILQVQELEVFIEGEEDTDSDGLDFSFSDSGLIWIIGLVNVILIVLIVIVAVRLSRR